MGGQRNLVIIGVAVLLGLLAVFIANAYFSGVEEKQARVAEQQKLARIVVASQPLEFGSPLTPDNVRLQNWPANSVPAGAFTSLDAALRLNRVALRPIVVGEPVLADKVSGKDGRATLAANLPEGMRAVSIRVNEVSGVSGFVLPGTTVDVLLTRQIPGATGGGNQDQMVDVVLENVQVLAVGQDANEKDGKPKTSQTATLQTDIYGAQKLALAEKIGTLSLALRNIENQQSAQVGTVTVRDLGGRPGYRPAARIQQAAQTVFVPRATPITAAISSGTTAITPVRTGPSMAVYRGVEKADYEVGRLGGN